MPESLAKKLNNKIKLLSEAQKQIFSRMYPEMPKDNAKLKWAITQCDNTIQKNIKNKEEIVSLYSEKELMQSLFVNKFGEIDALGIVDDLALNEMKSLLNYVEVITPPVVLITDGLKTTPRDQQLDFAKYENEAEAIESLKDAHDLFDCGQGYSQDQAETYCYIADVFFQAYLEAVCYGQWQEYGDKLYYVDHIKSVRFQPALESSYLEEQKIIKLNKLSAVKSEVERLTKELSEE